MTEETKKTIPLKLRFFPAMDWKESFEEKKDDSGKVVERKPTGKKELQVAKDQRGLIMYDRNDAVALRDILHRFDQRLHHGLDSRQMGRIFEKLLTLYKTQGDVEKETEAVIELSINEAAFLGKYLEEFLEKEGKQEKLAEYVLSTYYWVLDQVA